MQSKDVDHAKVRLDHERAHFKPHPTLGQSDLPPSTVLTRRGTCCRIFRLVCVALGCATITRDIFILTLQTRTIFGCEKNGWFS